jgi:hypothetical protein
MRTGPREIEPTMRFHAGSRPVIGSNLISPAIHELGQVLVKVVLRLLSRMLWVRIPPGAPLPFSFNDLRENAIQPTICFFDRCSGMAGLWRFCSFF